jgi:hypothetical protein
LGFLARSEFPLGRWDGEVPGLDFLEKLGGCFADRFGVTDVEARPVAVGVRFLT